MADQQKTPPAPYVFQPYPAKRYHASRAPVYVQTAAEDKALGPSWGERNHWKKPASIAPKDKE